eukprot:scaffold213194_cov22-Tisochrysis_lutea.AAC.2
MHLAIARDCDQLLAHKVGSLVSVLQQNQDGWASKRALKEGVRLQIFRPLKVTGLLVQVGCSGQLDGMYRLLKA